MKRHLLMLASLALVATCLGKDMPTQIDKANALPLALDDAFQFRKTKIFWNDPLLNKPTLDPMLSFERNHINFGAITQVDHLQRYGSYYTFFWRSTRKADLTIRFEYRQQKLGSYIQAKELYYPAAKGSVASHFEVIGDDYAEDGKVIAWRAILIENSKIVGLTQSFLWN